MTILEATEVRIPLYDRDWTCLQDVIDTFEDIVLQLRHDLERSWDETMWIEVEWESAAKEDVQFIKDTKDFSTEQFWLRYERQ